MTTDLDKPILEITWTARDVFDAFQERIGREPTDAELTECLNRIPLKFMQDRSIETGWDFIYQSVDESMDRGE